MKCFISPKNLLSVLLDAYVIFKILPRSDKKPTILMLNENPKILTILFFSLPRQNYKA